MKEVSSYQPSVTAPKSNPDPEPGARSPKPEAASLEERLARVEHRQDEIEAGLQRIDRALDVLLEQTRKSLDWLERKPRERKETPS